MKTRLRLLGAVALVLLGALAMPAAAQVTDPSPDLVVLSVTNDVPNNSTTTANLGATIDVSDYKVCGVQIKCALTGSGTTANTFTFARSADGTNWANAYPCVMTPAGATSLTTNYALDLGAFPYIKLAGITAANNSAAITNISVVVVRKPYPKDD